MKKFILPVVITAFSLTTLVACDGEEIDPCEDWWLDIELDEGVEFLDTDGDGEPDGLTYTLDGETITVICEDGDVDGDCIPDCFETFMDGEYDDDGEEDEDDEEDDDGEEEEGPCEDWWIGLDWIDGVELTDSDGDGAPDVLTYDDGDDTISIVCFDDLDEDCIPDCFEEYLM
ncbi:MAG: hypothetical protein ACI8ZM_005268 [Crocinitomix sp.]|jgi:hypothetical protein